MEKEFDLIVIGAGPGGYLAALEAARLGKRTALVEKNRLGGTCLNKGCIPTKTLLHSSELYKELLEGVKAGIFHGMVTPDLEKLWERKEAVTKSLREGIESQLLKSKTELFFGNAMITEPGRVCVAYENMENEVLFGKNILIASGSAPFLPPIPGMELEGVTDSDALLDKKELYSHLIIIGGGVIGMEFAALYSDLGKKVTVIEAMDRILPAMDREISQNLKMILTKRGVKFHTKALVREIKKAGSSENTLSCVLEEKEEVKEINGDGILVCVGRRPYTKGLLGAGLEEKLVSDKGCIQADSHFSTPVPGIYAIGDVTGGIQLAHMAAAQGQNAVHHMFGLKEAQNLSIIPSCVYTSPEIATVGLDAHTAKKAGMEIRTGKYIMSLNGRSVLSNQERGFIKLAAEKETGKIVGAQLMCARASDLIGQLSLAIAGGLTAEALGTSVMAHPTFSEGIREAAMELLHMK